MDHIDQNEKNALPLDADFLSLHGFAPLFASSAEDEDAPVAAPPVFYIKQDASGGCFLAIADELDSEWKHDLGSLTAIQQAVSSNQPIKVYAACTPLLDIAETCYVIMTAQITPSEEGGTRLICLQAIVGCTPGEWGSNSQAQALLETMRAQFQNSLYDLLTINEYTRYDTTIEPVLYGTDSTAQACFQNLLGSSMHDGDSEVDPSPASGPSARHRAAIVAGAVLGIAVLTALAALCFNPAAGLGAALVSHLGSNLCTALLAVGSVSSVGLMLYGAKGPSRSAAPARSNTELP